MGKIKKGLEFASRNLIAFTTPNSLVSEQFRTLRTNINFSSPDQKIQTIVITSAAPSEGKSTAAANLSIVFAQEGKKVLLVDADMRKPTMHHTFNVGNVQGLSRVLTRQSNLETAIRATKVVGLDLLTCGSLPPNPAELLGSKSMDTLIEQMKKAYDIVIFDAPPMLAVTDAQLLANKCDGAILIVNSGKTDKKEVVKAKETIVKSNCRLIGAVLNNFTLSKDSAYSHYYETEGVQRPVSISQQT
ncbi:CpsD/CapB family tyrosine-protein kinase [Planococcus salinus]|uniref:non-specific protein-tyrosine kinase n=1 Tax=Planococcus salinus TaxID=1848460 RepID=A0A3M8P755_9BACL|nr:CpsD/CapB family tyrosine-protein kinase [Planococcus salinus]RNF39507.1 polysaccharide biosynthesis tyrosine autokinase [Planococcus salinus]